MYSNWVYKIRCKATFYCSILFVNSISIFLVWGGKQFNKNHFFLNIFSGLFFGYIFWISFFGFIFWIYFLGLWPNFPSTYVYRDVDQDVYRDVDLYVYRDVVLDVVRDVYRDVDRYVYRDVDRNVIETSTAKRLSRRPELSSTACTVCATEARNVCEHSWKTR